MNRPYLRQRVKLAKEYSSYPLGIFPAGLTGTVTSISAEVIAVTLDKTRKELESWGNRLNVENLEGLTPDQLEAKFWEMWEPEVWGLSALVAEYQAYSKDNDLDLGSADEHFFDEDLTSQQQAWVRDFYERWMVAERKDVARDRLYWLAANARPQDPDEWGSERQINAQNAFFQAVEAIITREAFSKLEDYCLKANVDEMIDEGLRLAEEVWK